MSASPTHGDRPALVVLCSLGTALHHAQTPHALSERFHPVFFDVRGSGASQEDASTLTLDAVADDLEALRSHLDAPSLAVLGHSILGALAIEAARRRPATVSHVIAIGTPPFGDMARLAKQADEAFEREASPERKAMLQANLAGLPAEASPGQRLFAETPKRFFDPMFDVAPLFAGAVMRPEFFGHLFTVLAHWEVTDEAARLRAQLLLAFGRYDFVVPHTLCSDLAPKLPTATVEIFEQSGHQPHIEEPERFAERVGLWYERTR